ncbi:hypothetical protein CBL_13776 [Carabus blaptoides fortunei]
MNTVMVLVRKLGDRLSDVPNGLVSQRNSSLVARPIFCSVIPLTRPQVRFGLTNIHNYTRSWVYNRLSLPPAPLPSSHLTLATLSQTETATHLRGSLPGHSRGVVLVVVGGDAQHWATTMCCWVDNTVGQAPYCNAAQGIACSPTSRSRPVETPKIISTSNYSSFSN